MYCFEVDVDLETGATTFSLSSDDHTITAELCSALGEDSFITGLESQLEKSIPTIDIAEFKPSEDVVFELDVSINTDDSNANLIQAESLATALLHENGYGTHISTFFFCSIYIAPILLFLWNFRIEFLFFSLLFVVFPQNNV